MRNDEQTEFNIVMGLCVGHDSLFLKYSNAPCTVLAAKDRLLGHNPLAAIYTVDKSATTSRAGGMRMAPGRGRGHLCWWPLI